MKYKQQYKNALEKARELLSCCIDDRDRRTKIYRVEDIESIFPELKESEDERIRKGLINGFKECLEDCQYPKNAVKYWHNVEVDDILAWLENQGKKEADPRYEDLEKLLEADTIYQMAMNDAMVEEAKLKAVNALSNLTISKLLCLEKQGKQKTTNKIEPKFKVGDWCIDNEDDTIFQIVKVLDNTYTYRTNEGKEYSCTHYSLENDARLWTIQDAENGDVLVCNINKGEIGGDTEKLPNITPTICIYQNVDKDHDYIHSYCSLYDGKYLVPQNRMYYNTFVHNIRPANKEQRDFLFQKIKNDGYEWNAENKELSKQSLKITPKFCVGQLITDDNGTWYKITNIKCLDDWYYEVYDACEDYVCEDSTHLELCSIIDEKFRENRFVNEIKKMMGD